MSCLVSKLGSGLGAGWSYRGRAQHGVGDVVVVDTALDHALDAQHHAAPAVMTTPQRSLLENSSPLLAGRRGQAHHPRRVHRHPHQRLLRIRRERR